MSKDVKKRRVVVTGIGIVSPIGIGKQAFIDSLFQGRQGASGIELFDPKDYRTDFAAWVGEIKKADGNSKEKDRIYQFLDLACEELVNDAGIRFGQEDLEKIGVTIGTCLGNVDCLDRYFEAQVSGREADASTIIDQPHFMPAAYIADKYNLQNVVSVVDTACASGTNSIGYALDRIRYGHADMMISGGIDPFSRLSHSGFGGLRSLSTTRTRPFTKDRDGLLLGEGAGLVMLEELEHALARKAKIYAEVLGYGLSNDAYHETTPDPQGKGAQRAIEGCMGDAGINAGRVSYINAHGTGTSFNDPMELKAITAVFKERAKEIPVSTIKPMVGHTLGAAGGIEFIASVLSIAEGQLPPTINFTEPMDGFSDYDFVPEAGRKAEGLDVVLSNSFAFAGNTACIALGRYREEA